MKRGFTLPFNWIYILVVGSLVLIVGIAVLMGLNKSSHNERVYGLSEHVKYFISAAGNNPGAEEELNMQDISLHMSCTGIVAEGQDLAGSKDDTGIIFSPDTVSDDMVSYSLPWQLPMQIDNFGFITSKRVKYVIAGGGLGSRLLDFLPINLNKGQGDYQPESSGLDKIRFITFSDVPGSIDTIKDMHDSDITLVHIEILQDEESFPDSYGMVSYYVKEGAAFAPRGDVFVAGRASLLGALYAENKEEYECQMQKAILKMGHVLDIYDDRLSALSQPEDLKNCPYLEARTLVEDMSLDIIADGLSGLENLYGTAKLIRKENDMMKRLSCNRIY